jgi:hypothetical protein
MKIVLTLAALLLYGMAGFAYAAGGALPLKARISEEKMALVEDYQKALQRCRSHATKASRDSCSDRQKESVVKAIKDLEQDPKAYFAAKDSRTRDATTLKEARRLLAPPGKRIDRQ